MRRLFDIQPSRPDRAVHGYVYYRWTSRYMAVVAAALDRPWLGPVRTWAGQWLQRTHHAKVVSASDARRIISIDKPIEWRGLEHVVPFDVARDIVLDASPTIALATCACRAVAEKSGHRDGSCGPLASCLYVGDPIASFVANRQADARIITAEEALAVIEGAAERGNVHTLWFKDAADGRMYAICNCCTCCCIGLRSQEAGFSPLAGSGELAAVDAAACGACGACEQACPSAAISVDGVAVVDPALCLGCGVCERTCPTDAISMAPAPCGPAPLPWS